MYFDWRGYFGHGVVNHMNQLHEGKKADEIAGVSGSGKSSLANVAAGCLPGLRRNETWQRGAGTTCADIPLVARRLSVLQELGLGYLTLGEETPSLSGGEAQQNRSLSEAVYGKSVIQCFSSLLCCQ